MSHRVYRTFLHWTRTLHTYATMFALILLIFFSFTGIVLNHPAWFNIDDFPTRDQTAKTNLPLDLASGKGDASSTRALNIEVYLRMHEGARGERSSFDDEDDSTLIQFVGPGRKMEYTITKSTGKIDEHFEIHNTIALMADLHKGAGSGTTWRLFIDATALFLLFASLTGIILWISLPKRRTFGIIALLASIILCAACYLLVML